MGNLAFKMTIIEDTHLTLAVIQFKVEANNVPIIQLCSPCSLEIVYRGTYLSCGVIVQWRKLIYRQKNFTFCRWDLNPGLCR